MMRNNVKDKSIDSISFCLLSHPPHQTEIPATKAGRRVWEEQESFRNLSVSGPCLLPQPRESFGVSLICLHRGFVDPIWNGSVSWRKAAEVVLRGGRSGVSALDSLGPLGALGLEVTHFLPVP